MRILILGINFRPELAATGKYTGEMANWLARRGHDVRVVTAPPHYPQWRVLPGYSGWRYARERWFLQNSVEHDAEHSADSSPELQVFRCPIWVPRTPQGLKRLLHLASFGLSSWPVMLWQVLWRPDLVLLIEPTLFCSLQALLAAWCSGAKAWLHIQDFEVDAAFELGDFSWSWLKTAALNCERQLLRYFDRVSTISDRMVERLKSKGVEPSRCILFPNWVDTNVIFPLSSVSLFRKELGIAAETIVCLYSGSMGNKQGLDLLVGAARRLSKRTDVRFVFCGEGVNRNSIAQQAHDLPNTDLVRFQPAERLNDLLNLADIHLLPQRVDAADLVMPSKLTGMFASGRPVVVTANQGTQLATAVDGRGLVVPPGDVECFASAILQLVEDRELRLRFGRAARTYAQDHLEFSKILLHFERAVISACEADGKGVSEVAVRCRTAKVRTPVR